MATKTLVPLLALALLGSAACGSAERRAGTGLPADVAAGLADRADQVAAALDRGDCADALAQARSLQTDIAVLTLEPAVKTEALAGAARLVGGISCPPPTTAPVVTVDPGPAEKRPKGKERKEHEG